MTTDSVVGVTFLGDDAPEYFSDLGTAFFAMFRITIGSAEWWFEAFPTTKSPLALAGPLMFFISYVVRGWPSACGCLRDAALA